MPSDPWYTVVIPTRDSAAWIGTLLTHYRARGVTPTLLVDSRTCDETRSIAAGLQAPIVEMPGFSFTESMVALTREIVKTPWALFVHDDEVPSDGLFGRLAGQQPPATAQSVAIPRRWAWYREGAPLSYGRSDHWRDRAGNNGSDHHWRLFRPKDVTFVSQMHSDGFLIDRWSRMPQEAYLVHFEWVIRSHAQRVAKLRGYDRYRFGYGAFFANMYLPEDQPDGVIEFIPFETDEFDELARAYYAARKPDVPVPPLTLAERWARIRNAVETRLGLTHHSRTPKDREGLTPRLDAEVFDPVSKQ